ncbi:golgin subfamily A member 7B isoform X1 [Canis lupus familiaris]|uniref:golgin subfamily A member 7B isoform X1 n=1 Tax=Canis lupus familiaris TaxID=9615 RepID=UPI0018F3F4A2|nr:golgin subfamily A member 7B isoform X1 [Canis lupus familiaris]
MLLGITYWKGLGNLAWPRRNVAVGRSPARHLHKSFPVFLLKYEIWKSQVHNLQELRRSASLATKVFIQRDYSDGTICQFQTKFPPELDSRIERQLFEETVKTLNGFYAEAEKIGGSSYLEGCLACATAYFIFLCMETHYEKVLKKISRYIQEQNEKIFAPRGLLLTDPVERGMRVALCFGPHVLFQPVPRQPETLLLPPPSCRGNRPWLTS